VELELPTRRARRTARGRRLRPWSLLAALTLGLAGCGNTALGQRLPPGRVPVVAAEDFWGSIAAQVGGRHAYVQSILRQPGTDPHSYEPTAADAVRLARARLAILTGIGYDPWASQLLRADGRAPGSVLDAGRLLGQREGANPHIWYSPADVLRVTERIAVDLGRLDPHDRAYFARRERWLTTYGFADYRRLIATIRRRYRNVPVGYSESIFTPLGHALGLRLLTPGGFTRAIAEGSEVTPGDLATAERQARRRLIRVWIYNTQNDTPEVAALTNLARRAGIPVLTITETLSPASTSFQAWQSDQLRRLLDALQRATER
jgi:zinc/manganese transport system substrate-binding protein